MLAVFGKFKQMSHGNDFLPVNTHVCVLKMIFCDPTRDSASHVKRNVSKGEGPYRRDAIIAT